ncbi:MAG TPA: hypothetical protein VM695_14270 [Phycisphaerae bacterium]|nr:hypothetical protein [Phycisphaerae bacterium]
MTRSRRHALLCGGLVACLIGPATADEIDDLAARLNVPATYHGYKAKFHYTQKTLTFDTPQGPERRLMRFVQDGDNYVAMIADEHIEMLAFTPASARQSVSLRTGRYHLDNLRDPILPTNMSLDKPRSFRTRGVVGIPQTDHFRGGGPDLTLVRATDSRQRKVLSQFVFRVHEQYGYVVEGTTTVTFKESMEPADRKAETSIFCPNACVPWPTRWTYDYTLFCPAQSTDVFAYPNNALVIDRVDRNQKQFTLRDRGFVAFLHATGGISPCRTREDGQLDAPMTVDPVRNQLHVTIPFKDELKKDQAGREEFVSVQRLLALPPAVAEHLRKTMKPLSTTGLKGLILAVGKTEDFEDQPVSLAEPVRGLAWTADPPPLTYEAAHSGKRSLVLTGEHRPNDPLVTMEPDIPYVPLRPKAVYRLEAWFKVEDLTDPQRADYVAAYKQMAARLKDAKQEVPEYVAPKRHAEAYVTGNLFETSPKERRWVARHQGSPARGGATGWQKSTVEFETPAWDPYIQVGFVVDSGSAHIDDFTLQRIR